MKAWLRLVRISLAPSAAADPVAGLVCAAGGFPADARAFWLVPASLGVYHGALALNDWRDREHDAATRAGRPIPSGAVRPGAALALGLLLILSGVACAGLAAPASAAWMGGVALLAVLYDLAGRGAWRGPLLLAACRAGNLGAGAAWALGAGVAPASPLALLAPAGLYGLYVFLVARLGRLEDGEDQRAIEQRPRALLCAAAAALVLLALAPAEAPAVARAGALVLALSGAAGLAAEGLRRPRWTRGDVEHAMGLALRRLLVATAVVALLGARPPAWEGALAAGLILLGFPLGHALRRAFPPS
ncbi:MAG: UbiA family prenyltransferase [Planctomycetes bacterium]|nr:UbiA family prenyltransferase [Planctomycetota bacterium]